MPLHPQPRRLFIALMPDRATQAQLQRHSQDWDWPAGCRPEPASRFHLTLHFLGDVPQAQQQRLGLALREVAMPPLELELGIAELWPNQVAVLRPAEHAGLRALHAHIAQVLPEAGLEVEAREYRPHVTLARKVRAAAPPARIEPVRWTVREFALVWSAPQGAGRLARYEVLEWFGAGAPSLEHEPAMAAYPAIHPAAAPADLS